MTAQSLLIGLATEETLEALRVLIAAQPAGTSAAPVFAAPSLDQDPIFDTANGAKVPLAATTSTELIVVPSGCKFIRVEADYDTFLAFADGTAGDSATCIKIAGGMPAETVPVTPGETINAYSASAATVRAMPYKVR